MAGAKIGTVAAVTEALARVAAAHADLDELHRLTAAAAWEDQQRGQHQAGQNQEGNDR